MAVPATMIQTRIMVFKKAPTHTCPVLRKKKVDNAPEIPRIGMNWYITMVVRASFGRAFPIYKGMYSQRFKMM
jgi:hypothetical protein